MSQDNAVDFNSQAVTPDTLVSVTDDPGKYEVELTESVPEIPVKDLPKESTDTPTEERRQRTVLVSRYYTLMQAWGVLQTAWEDDARVSLTITAGANGIHFADNTNNLSATGIASGVGIGHVFPNTVMTLVGFTGPLYMYSDTDSSPVSIVAVTVQK